MGYLAAFGVIACLIVGIYSFGYAVKNTSLLFVLLIETGAGLILTFPLIIFSDHYNLHQIFSVPKFSNWLWLGAASLCGFVAGNFFSLWNLRISGERINSLLSPAITATAILFSIFLFQQFFSFHQYVGMGITLTSIIAFLLKQTLPKMQLVSTSGFISSIGTIVFISATIICTIKGASGIKYFTVIWLRLLFAFPIVLTLALRFKNKIQINLTPKILLTIGVGLLAQTILAAHLWLVATFTISIAVFQTILATLPLWIYIVDVYCLKRTLRSKYFFYTAFVAALGIALAVF